jgi:putative glutamine amidotransferase
VPETYGAADAGSNSDMDQAADAWEIALLHSAAARRLPTLAICRGAQLLACAFGGSPVPGASPPKRSTAIPAT